MAPYECGIFEEFSKVVKLSPLKPAIFFKHATTYHTVTYQKLYTCAIQLGNLLLQKGIRASSKVAILLGNQQEWPISFMAIRYAAAVAVPIDTRLPAQEITRMIIHSQTKIILCSHTIYSRIKKFLDGLDGAEVLLVDEEGFFNRLKIPPLETKPNTPQESLDKVAAFFYTSGTTALPKAVMLSEGNLLSNASSIARMQIVDAGDVFISFLPLHHTYSFMVTCLVPLLQGASISYPASLSPDDLMDCIKSTGVSILVGVPQFYLNFHKIILQKLRGLPFLKKVSITILIEICWFLRKTLAINLAKIVLKKLHRTFGRNLRFMIAGGARLEKSVHRDLFKWGFIILEGYGLTETSPLVAFNPPAKAKPGSVGKAVPDVQIKIVNSDEQGIGEVVIKGPNVMAGYYELPEETKERLQDGWFFTKDLGYLDKEGYLYITGRKDETIVLSSGKKINPEDIERHYTLSPFIQEICVFISAKSEGVGQAKQLMALVVPHEEYFNARGQANIEEKIKWELDNLSQRLPSYKRVKGFMITKEKLPRTALGKLMRHKIEEKFALHVAVSNRQEDQRGVPLGNVPLGNVPLGNVPLGNVPLEEKILRYLSEQLHRQVRLEDHLELDLGLDSLDRIELLSGLESFLKIKASESLTDDLSRARTVQEVLFQLTPMLPQEITEALSEKFHWSNILQQPPSAETLNLIRLQPFFVDKLIVVSFIIALRIIFRTAFLLRIKKKQDVPVKGPYIIYVNHASYLDPLLIASCLPLSVAMNTYFLGFKQIFQNRLLTNFVKMSRFLPIDSAQNLVDTMQACAYLLKKSKIICIFPEGQRSADGEVIRFKRGIAILAKELNIPLVPVYIEGSFKAWSRHSKLPKPSKLTIYIGKGLAITEKDHTYGFISEFLRNELLRLRPES